MSNNIFIDINAQNSRLNATNNILNYELPEALSLPTGTEIKLLQSIVNQQGTVGTSITIDEDIEESIIIQYYISDTDINVPSPALNTTTTLPEIQSWQLFDQMSSVFHAETTFGPNGFGGAASSPYGTLPYGQEPCGGTEIVMPIVRPCNMNTTGSGTVDRADEYFAPFTTQIDIKISKGVYNVNKLAEIITDQINGSKLAGTNDKSSSDLFQEENEFTGMLTNDTTLKRVSIFKEEAYSEYVNTGTKPTDFGPYRPTAGVSPRPLIAGENDPGGLTAIAIHPNLSKIIRQNLIGGNVGTNAYAPSVCDNLIPDASASKQMFRGLQLPYEPGSVADVIQQSYLGYNVMSNGFGVGSSNFNLKVNEDGEFEIAYCHTPRFIPTYDFFGNKMDNPGQECAYRKAIAGNANNNRNPEFPSTRSSAGHVPRPLAGGFYRAQSQPMKRTTGFMVLNWAYKTCLDDNDGVAPPLNPTDPLVIYDEDKRNAIPSDRLREMDKNRTFDEWFRSKEDARKAWEKTLWYKIGFSYDDIQNPDNFERQYFPNITNTEETTSTVIEGFTTTQRLDSSAITTASTLVNGAAHSSSGAFQPDGAIGPIPGNISGIQIFNTADINIPYDSYNNNKKNEVEFGNTTGAYKGSFYYGAVMVPVITSGIPVSASRLPSLNSNGYMLVTSDLVEPNDIVKKNSYLGLLDIIPKSNLQNTDYIQERNVLSHTLSNPTIIKEITLKVRNPDLTDIDLEPNSAFLLQITYPQPKQTVMLKTLQNNASEQNIATALNKVTAKSLEDDLIPNFDTFEQYNQVALQQPVAETSEEASDRRTASRRRIDIAKLAVRYNSLETEEQRREFLERQPEKDRAEIERVGDSIREKREARTGRGGGGVARGAREPSPEPSPEALAKARAKERGSDSPRLRPRGERGRFKGVVPPVYAQETLIQEGGRSTSASIAQRERGKRSESGIGSQSVSAEPRSRSMAPEPPEPPKE